MTYSLTSPDAVILDTRIPESHRVEGLEYGRHVSLPHRGRSGYYVRPEGTERWALAYLTPAGDEVYDTDAEIVEAIRQEIAEVHEAIQDAAERGETSLEMDGIVYSWEVETPTIEIIGLGDDDWTEEADGEEREDAADAREWERYGTIEVCIGDVTYDIGCVIGVPEYLRGTARAAGGDTVTPYLDAWYADASDYRSAPGDDGSTGIPSDLADEVLAAIRGAARRLWAEYQAEVAEE